MKGVLCDARRVRYVYDQGLRAVMSEEKPKKKVRRFKGVPVEPKKARDKNSKFAPPPRYVTDLRRTKIAKLMAMGVSYPEIRSEILRENDISERTLQKDVKGVYELWEKEGSARAPHYRNQYREMLKKAYQAAMTSNQIGAAVSAVGKLIEIDGCKAPENVNVNHSGTIESRIERMSSDDQRKRIEELIVQYATGTAPEGLKDKAINGTGEELVN